MENKALSTDIKSPTTALAATDKSEIISENLLPYNKFLTSQILYEILCGVEKIIGFWADVCGFGAVPVGRGCEGI